jgi:putative FmdB family regulatory protein
MPIYEYECRHCGHQFECLTLPSSTTAPACPACKGEELERLLSGFAVNTAELSRARVKQARAVKAQSKDQKEQKVAEAERVKDHRH